MLGRLRTLRAFFLAAALLLGACLARAAEGPVLTLQDARGAVDAWPAVSLLHDPDARLDAAGALAASDRFEPPRSAYSTLGLKHKVMWLRIPVDVPADSTGRWILDVDYTLLNRLDVHVARGGRLVSHAALGNSLPFSARPIKSRSHAVLLELAPGERHDILVRVDTIGAMILPITLSKLSAFHQRALDEQMLQGVLASLAACLLLYSLLQWASLRETMYLKYAILILGSGLFSVHFFGIGEMYLWTDNFWMERHLAGLTSLTAAMGTALFIEDVLGSDMSPLLRRLMKIIAGVLAAAALLHAADVIDIHGVSIVMGTLGLLPALLGLPGAIARVRRGDSVGAWFLVAWASYFVVSAIMVGVVKGTVGVSFWTLHAFQFGATLDMLIFMRIAVLRSAAIHLAAQRATQERDTLHSMAHSDQLTGLLNRRGLNSMLSAALHNCNPEQLLAIYMMDLDGFKPVNDQFGHDVGDELLEIVAQRLKSTVRNGDVVARVGGDEFVVMAGGLGNADQARELGAKLQAAFAEPFSLGNQSVRVGITIGYVLAPLDGWEADPLMKAADAAMYSGKQAGKNALRRAVPALGT